MINTGFNLQVAQPAVTRLSALAELGTDATAALQHTITRAGWVAKRHDLITEGRAIVEPQMIVSGWAARVRLLIDGRRQFIGFLLPGDIVGLYQHQCPLAAATVTALTNCTVCTPPRRGIFPGLDEAYAVSQALDEAYALAQIVRLGRLNAQERIGDILLELNERLALNGTSDGGTFELPLTQEILADALGLTAVHVNRMLQTAKQNGDIVWKHGRMTLTNPASLARRAGRMPTTVSEALASI